MDDPAFPHVTYRRGASGWPAPVLRGTGIRVQALAVAAQQWELSPAQIAAEYSLTKGQVEEALAFCEAHRHGIEASIAAEQSLEQTDV